MPDEDQQERESRPGTEPFVPVFDTGPHPQAAKSPATEHGPGTDPYIPTFDTGAHPQAVESPGADDEPGLGEQSATAAPRANTTTGEAPPLEPPAAQSGPLVGSSGGTLSESSGAPAQPFTVPSRYHYLKWWKLVLVIMGVWIVAAAIGLGLFSWWYDSINKTPAVFVVLVYVVVCIVGGLMLAMVQDKPLLSALAIAVMSAVFASVAAAAPLYGSYYCARTQHCVVGIIPY